MIKSVNIRMKILDRAICLSSVRIKVGEMGIRTQAVARRPAAQQSD